MFRQAAFFTVLAWVGGCYVGDDRGAETKFQGGGGQADIETFYVASIAGGTVPGSIPGRAPGGAPEYLDGSQTMFLTRLVYNYATGEARVTLKTIDKHGAVRSKCDELARESSEIHIDDPSDISGGVAYILENLGDGSMLGGGVIFNNDAENGSQLRFVLSGEDDVRGKRVSYNIVDSTIRVSEGMARRAPESKVVGYLSQNIKEPSYIKSDSESISNFIEAIETVTGKEMQGFDASTGLLGDEYFNSIKHPAKHFKLHDKEFWQDAFSNCSSGSQSGGSQPNENTSSK